MQKRHDKEIKEKIKQYKHEKKIKKAYKDEASKLYEFWNDPDVNRKKIN